MSSHETTSGRKLSKKARQIFRREHEAEVKLAAQKVGRLIGNAIKPKPKYIPMAMWKWMMGFFIEIKKSPSAKT